MIWALRAEQVDGGEDRRPTILRVAAVVLANKQSRPMALMSQDERDWIFGAGAEVRATTSMENALESTASAAAVA
jgi:hypothetical protein